MKNKWLENLQNEFHQKTVGAFQEKMNEMYEMLGVESPYAKKDNDENSEEEEDFGGMIYVLDVGGHNFKMKEIVKEINLMLSIFGETNELPTLKIRAVLWTSTPESLKKYISEQSTMVIFGSTANVSAKATELYPTFDQNEFPINPSDNSGHNNPEVSSLTNKARLPQDKDKVEGKSKFMDNNLILVKQESFKNGRVMYDMYAVDTPDNQPVKIEDSLPAIAATVIHGLGHNAGMQYFENIKDRGHTLLDSIMASRDELHEAIKNVGGLYNLIKKADKDLHTKISTYFYRKRKLKPSNLLEMPKDNTHVHKKDINILKNK